MFKKNTKHLEPGLFGIFNSLPETMKKKALRSEEYHFYHLIFRHIDEEIFSVLYSDKKSRPNAPINAMVASLILMHRYQWTYEELFKNLQFNLLTKLAIGVDRVEEVPFCPATLFNFQNRLNQYSTKTGRNLLEVVFDRLTDKQKKLVKIKTGIQRTDSFQAASNIRNYTRLQLLVELVIRIYRVLKERDKERFRDRFQAYISKSSEQYIYSIKASDIPHEFDKLAELYFWIYKELYPIYGEEDIFQIFLRVLLEHFTIGKKKLRIKPSERLRSDSLQSPDDLDATYRKKGGKVSKGQVINLVETADPDNRVNLITDIAVYPNNVDDSRILQDRLDRLKEKTPDLEELHFDGAYGSEANDRKLESYGIRPVQTGIRGKREAVTLEIEKVGAQGYEVSCPHQKVAAQKVRKRYKAVFDPAICQGCKDRDHCPVKARKGGWSYSFSEKDYLRKKRHQAILAIPPERRKLRNNIEATVNEFVHRMPKGKLKVRGAFKTAVFAYMVGAAVNFGRIYRYLMSNWDDFSSMFSFVFQKSAHFLRHFLLFNKIRESKGRFFFQATQDGMLEHQISCF